MNTILQRQYAETRSKYLKFSTRLKRSKKSGRFYQYSARKQNWLVSRVKKLWEKLRMLEKQLKFAVAAGSITLVMGIANPVFGQPSLTKKPAKNPFPPPMIYGMSPVIKDVDGDGDLDILTMQGEESISFFKNTGTPTAPVYEKIPDDLNPFIFPDEWDIETWNIEAIEDLDGDGDMDLLTEESGYEFLKNTGTASDPAFEPEPTSFSPYNGAFVDIDGDGDLDQASVFESYYDEGTQQQVNSPHVRVYRNNGSGINYDESDMIMISGFPAGEFYLDDLAVIDFEGDGDPDFLLEVEPMDEYYDKYALIENTGSQTEPAFSFVDELSNPFWQIENGWGEIHAVDFDGDGDSDALVEYNYSGFNFYRNTEGTLARDESYDFLEGDVLNPSYVSPKFMDYDGDGDLDMYTFTYEGDTPGVYYENTGNSKSPEFTARDEYFSFIPPAPDGYYYFYPLFVDLDSDGDLDALVLNYDSYNEEFLWEYYKNNGTQQSSNYQLTDSPLPVFEDTYTFPSFADMDNDGDLDLVITQEVYVPEQDEDYLEILYYENTGSSENIVFELTEGTDSPFSNIDQLAENYFTPLILTDIDRDGDLDLIHTDYDGQIYHFENVGTAEEGTFVDVTESSPFANIFGGYYGGISLVDLDDDGDEDLVVTSLYNTIMTFYENTDLSGGATAVDQLENSMAVEVYPNPAEDNFRIKLDSPYDGEYSLEIFDINGRMVRVENFRKSSGLFEQELNVSELSQGLYMIKVSAGNEQHTTRMMIK